VAVFGLGAVGLAVIQAAKMRGCSRIFAIDINPSKFAIATELGTTDCISPRELPEGTTIQQHIVSLTKWGVDYTFDATGSVQVMRSALECAHRGWGQSCVIGVAPAGHEISTRPFQLVTGRQWKGTAFGGFKSRTEVPGLVEQYLTGELPIEQYITHEFEGVENIDTAMHVRFPPPASYLLSLSLSLVKVSLTSSLFSRTDPPRRPVPARSGKVLIVR
jgi:S-(hydroxymethyl)glutathione dehydrogenase/alcohol dehydrogenase